MTQSSLGVPSDGVTTPPFPPSQGMLPGLCRTSAWPRFRPCDGKLGTNWLTGAPPPARTSPGASFPSRP